MGKKRVLGASVLAAGLVLSGCGTGGEEDPTTTTSAVAQGPANPWDLPLEQRPPLFDPCQEPVVAAVEAGVGTPMAPNKTLRNTKPSELNSCGWENDEVRVFVLSTWKSHGDYLADDEHVIEQRNYSVAGREGTLLTISSEASERSCHGVFSTSRGTVMIALSLRKSLRDFRGELLNEGCDALDVVVAPIVDQIPEGDFR